MIFGFLGKFGIGIAPKIIGKVHLVAENGPLKVGDIDFFRNMYYIVIQRDFHPKFPQESKNHT